jgi:nucleolin
VEREQPSGCKSVFIKNLPYDATEAIISDVFSVFGKIVPGGVRLPLVNPGAAEGEHSFGKIKGFGYVTFKEPEHALACVNKARKPYGVEVSGRPIMCDYDAKGEAGVKASFRTQDGTYWGKEFGEDKNKGGAQKRKGGPKL